MFLTGNTKILTTDQVPVQIKDFHKNMEIFSVQKEKIISTATSKSLVSEITSVLFRVTMNTQSIITCGKNQVFLLKSGEIKEAKFLKRNDKLIHGQFLPLRCDLHQLVEDVEVITLKNPIKLYSILTEQSLNCFLDNGVLVGSRRL